MRQLGFKLSELLTPLEAARESQYPSRTLQLTGELLRELDQLRSQISASEDSEVLAMAPAAAPIAQEWEEIKERIDRESAAEAVVRFQFDEGQIRFKYENFRTAGPQLKTVPFPGC